MSGLNLLDVRVLSKVKGMDLVADIQSLDGSVHSQSDIDVLVCMATDVEVTRYLLDGKAANKSASISFLKCLLCHFELFHLVGLPQQLEIFAVQIIAG